ncbi:hypothetical protein ONZ43_g2653 [Nemania bipapillata]|uniref:Uncharacterized protein n=1 Tax=Nemania bipapillata TaxID=110536 RepID=A0ACC2IZU0_9PEZI|nr:hypothetical protein ONZ43_g2653 [Nemania bipapillata]
MADDSVYALNVPAETGMEEECDRLNFQHHFFDDVMHNELLPSHIASQLATNPAPRICEVATGTGIWLRDLSKTLPASAELVGLDFDITKFPKPEELPPNVKLDFGNTYEPFPEKFQNYFDVVNMRFFLFAVKRDGGVALAQHLLSLLRPGGWLIWTETSPFISAAVPPSEPWFEFRKAYYTFAAEMGLDTE